MQSLEKSGFENLRFWEILIKILIFLGLGANQIFWAIFNFISKYIRIYITP